MNAVKLPNRYNVSMPGWFRDLAGKRANALGMTFAAYMRHVLRADMEAAGIDVAAPKRTRKGARS